jgi:hypothetical protein
MKMPPRGVEFATKMLSSIHAHCSKVTICLTVTGDVPALLHFTESDGRASYPSFTVLGRIPT